MKTRISLKYFVNDSGLKTSMKVINLSLNVFSYIIYPNRGESNVDSPDWIKNKKQTHPQKL